MILAEIKQHAGIEPVSEVRPRPLKDGPRENGDGLPALRATQQQRISSPQRSYEPDITVGTIGRVPFCIVGNGPRFIRKQC